MCNACPLRVTRLVIADERNPMRQIPVLDYTCSRCGHTDTLQPVKVDRHGVRPSDEGPAPRSTIPTLDYTCSRCGANDTLTLVKTRSPE